MTGLVSCVGDGAVWWQICLCAVLRSRPTCHGIRCTVIDTARESLIFHFFCIILCLDPCWTGLLQPLDLHSHHAASYQTHASNPHHVHCLTDSLVPCYLYPSILRRHHDV